MSVTVLTVSQVSNVKNVVPIPINPDVDELFINIVPSSFMHPPFSGMQSHLTSTTYAVPSSTTTTVGINEFKTCPAYFDIVCKNPDDLPEIGIKFPPIDCNMSAVQLAPRTAFPVSCFDTVHLAPDCFPNNIGVSKINSWIIRVVDEVADILN